ncbi:uncharacterized protein LOC108036704 [Drosophila biarmipes]|uniref:uncharacterized protein LOC108036704 n=1 Tax=Drosophila biarmipes TaxID=125945 RepID=UPI0007E61315|nr:uncharacterized protein LOC108036704 [Drosophila biarmipes]
MGLSSPEIARDQWAALRDLYAGDRTNLAGFDLIEYFLNYKPPSQGESVKIYSTDEDWPTHGSFTLVHYLDSRAYVYLNTIGGLLEDVSLLLCSLNLKIFHLICGYGERLKPLVENYWVHLGKNLSELDHQGAIVYHLPSDKVPRLHGSNKVGYLSAKNADLVDQHST